MAVICNIVTDLMIFTLPFPLLVHLRVPRAQLYGLIFIFSLGLLCIFATIARVIAISLNTTTTQIAVWSSAELATGIMVACSPTLRVLLRRTSTNRSKNNTPPSPEVPVRARQNYTGQSWKNGPMDTPSPDASPVQKQGTGPWYKRARSLSRPRPEDSGWKPPSRAEQRELNRIGETMRSINNDRDIFVQTRTNISVEQVETLERGRPLSPYYEAQAHGGHAWRPEKSANQSANAEEDVAGEAQDQFGDPERDVEANQHDSPERGRGRSGNRMRSRSRSAAEMFRVGSLRSGSRPGRNLSSSPKIG
jgi:hypothetical protein